MIVKETIKGRNNKQFVYYRCTKCNTRTRADKFESKADKKAEQNLFDINSDAISAYYRQLHSEATKKRN